MFYMLTSSGQLPHIEQHDSDPFPLRNVTVSIGYATMDELRWGKGLEPCDDCGGPDLDEVFLCGETEGSAGLSPVLWVKRKNLERAV